MKTITSRDNALFKQIKALAHTARERRKAGLALIEGTHLVACALDARVLPHTLVLSETALANPEAAALAAQCGTSERVTFSDALFAEVSTFETPSGILALIEPPAPEPVAHDVSACLLIEDIQDPGNVGSILRSAAAAGVRHVLLSKHCAFAWAPKVLRAGQGAHFLLNIVDSADLAAFAHDFEGTVLALVPRAASSIYEQDMRQSVAIMAGNEGAGLSPQLLSAAHRSVAIPMPGKTESLNAAAAAAICLFEMVRQRGAR
jgi:TrmH family RNA methyltransferase